MALRPRLQRAAAALGLALVVAAVYWPMRGHGWLNYDDDVYVTASAGAQLGLSRQGIAWALTSWEGANWFPLTRLSWLADVEIHGDDAGGFHTTSLVLHAVTSALLFLALARLTGAPLPSAAVAAIFGLHPLHVESVAWISARKDTLSGLFFALTLLAYAPRPGARGETLRRGLVFLFLALGLLAKQTLVVVPFLLLLLDDWPLGRLRRVGAPGRFDTAAVRAALVEKLPLFALVAGFAGVALLAQDRGGTVAELGQLGAAERLANALVAAATYAVRAVWPTGLAVFYPHPEAGLSPFLVTGAALLLAGATALALRAGRRPSPVATGWLWYGVALAPVIGLVQVGSQAMADRYTYLPLVGLSIAAVFGGRDLATRWLPDPGRRRAVLGALALVGCLALGAATRAQLAHWRDSETLMRRALAVTSDNFVAHAHLGSALLERGAGAEAISHWRAAARIEPGFTRVRNNLAWLLATAPDSRLRAPAEAVVHARAAARLAPADPAVLDTLAAAYASAGRFRIARSTAQRALALAEADGNLALVEEIRRRLARYRRGRPWIER